MPSITINIDDEQKKILEKRAKKNLMTLRELIEDIIRRSAIRTKKGSRREDKIDDRLVKIFSKSRVGRKRISKGVKTRKLILERIKKGESLLKSGRIIDAREIYKSIRKSYGRSKNKDKKTYDKILGFYNKLKRKIS